MNSKCFKVFTDLQNKSQIQNQQNTIFIRTQILQADSTHIVRTTVNATTNMTQNILAQCHAGVKEDS